jgi:hypothetical protein
MSDQNKTNESTASEPKTEIMTTGGAVPALSPEQLAMMQKDSGKQRFEIRELMVPVLKIANTTSGVMKKSDSEYRKEAEEGDLYDSLTFTFYKPPVQLIIVRFQTNYIESKPKMGPTVKLWGQDRSGYDRAVGRDVGVRITQDGNEIREVGTYYCLLLRPDGLTLPSLMYLGSTSWREARRLNALLGSMELMGPDGPFIAPPYARYYSATTVPATDGQNTWMTWKFDPGAMVLATDRGVHYYQRARELEEAIDKNQTRIVGTADDERFAEGQRARQTAAGGSGGPPPDHAPPPEDEPEGPNYRDNQPSGGTSRQEAIVEKARDAPF